MFFKIRNICRWIVVIMGGTFALLKFFDKTNSRQMPDNEGFQTAEFDDIW